jgi:uncharacterized membrane protein YfhO
MDADGWLVASVPAWKGWRATVDGRRVKTQIADYAFVSVHVPAGTHDVLLEYLPQSFIIGRTISVITAIAVLATAIFLRLRRRNSAVVR